MTCHAGYLYTFASVRASVGAKRIGQVWMLLIDGFETDALQGFVLGDIEREGGGGGGFATTHLHLPS